MGRASAPGQGKCLCVRAHACVGERGSCWESVWTGAVWESGLEGETAAASVGFYGDGGEAKPGNTDVRRPLSKVMACTYRLQSFCAFLYV